MNQAGINQSSHLYLTESFHIPALECYGFLAQGCVRNDYYDSTHMDLGDDFVFDILPSTLDGLLSIERNRCKWLSLQLG